MAVNIYLWRDFISPITELFKNQSCIDTHGQKSCF